ncbi:MBL fold metallo-hydrolase [Halorubellus salinus]|uniref:MBL fold metallo-hydrolase n=1 Tax=Halorubellus salinus TaxID=755309 RepID=UPI001D06FE22
MVDESSTTDDASESDDCERVERVQVSTAYGSGPEGGNSAWVLPDPGIVVDPGPPGDVAFDSVRSGLEEAGIGLEGVRHVLVTHWHVDHAGLAPRLATEADASLHLHERDAPLVAAYATERERRVDRDAAALSRWGVPDEHVASIRDADSPSPIPDETPVNDLAAGDAVGPLAVVETPGHTAGHVAFSLHAGDGSRADSRVLVGDAALRTVTPNVGGGDTRQETPLAAYRTTLDRLAGEGWRALPGHGTAFDLAPRLAELRAHHRERAALVADSLAALAADENDADGVTPWAVARDRFGDMTGYHVKFGAGEAFAHLQDLAALGYAERVADDPLRYRAVDEGTELALDVALDDAWRGTDQAVDD